MKIAHGTSAFLALTLALGAAHAKAACSDATLHGKYTFTVTGQILAPAPAAGLVNGVAMTYFDGDGYLHQVDHVVHNGVLPVENWRPADGHYSINPDCTGWMTITPHPTETADNSPELKLYLVVSVDGSEVHNVVSGSPVNPLFVANISGNGTRVGWGGW
jgi:hypothetical protein